MDNQSANEGAPPRKPGRGAKPGVSRAKTCATCNYKGYLGNRSHVCANAPSVVKNKRAEAKAATKAKLGMVHLTVSISHGSHGERVVIVGFQCPSHLTRLYPTKMFSRIPHLAVDISFEIGGRCIV